MKLYLIILLIAAMLVVYQFVRMCPMKKMETFAEEDQENLEQGLLQFYPDETCKLGSAYKLGQGCDESIFDSLGQTRKESVFSRQLLYYTLSKAVEVGKMIDKKAQFNGVGWGQNIRPHMHAENLIHETANTVSIAINDYRTHYYTSILPSQAQIDSSYIEDFQSNPIEFMNNHGYYFVLGITTGSSFQGALNYESESKEVLNKINNLNLNGNTKDYYESLTYTAAGKATLKQNLIVNGSTNFAWDRNDVAKSYSLYQNNIDESVAVKVTVSRYVSLPAFKEALNNMQDQALRAKVQSYSQFQDTQLKTISNAYSIYELLATEVSEHLQKVGHKLPLDKLQKLQIYQSEIERRIKILDDLKLMEQLINISRYDAIIKEPKKYLEEVTGFLKLITGRSDV